MLVSVEGNTYMSVPVLDFGSDQGDEQSARRTAYALALDPLPIRRYVFLDAVRDWSR